MGTVCGRGEGAGSAGGVARRRPANGVARRPLEGKETIKKYKCRNAAV